MTDLTFLVNTYNRLEYTQRCIASIFQHAPERSNILVVDNNSTDGTQEWLRQQEEEFALDAILLDNNLDCGGAARVACGYLVGSDYVACFDNDGVFNEHADGWWDRVLGLFGQFPKVAFVGLMRNPRDQFGLRYVQKQTTGGIEFLAYPPHGFTAFFVMKRTAFVGMWGKFFKNFAIRQDFLDYMENTYTDMVQLFPGVVDHVQAYEQDKTEYQQYYRQRIDRGDNHEARCDLSRYYRKHLEASV